MHKWEFRLFLQQDRQVYKNNLVIKAASVGVMLNTSSFCYTSGRPQGSPLHVCIILCVGETLAVSLYTSTRGYRVVEADEREGSLSADSSCYVGGVGEPGSLERLLNHFSQVLHHHHSG